MPPEGLFYWSSPGVPRARQALIFFSTECLLNFGARDAYLLLLHILLMSADFFLSFLFIKNNICRNVLQGHRMHGSFT